tara:strand:- start:1063 stop:1734 length:672 start_codon:yes stop_codon:yes gene_type:complete
MKENLSKKNIILRLITLIFIIVSLVTLFLPWYGYLNPINIVEFKNKVLGFIFIREIPFLLDAPFYLGYMSFIFLLFSLVFLFLKKYRFINYLFLILISSVFLLMTLNIYKTINGDHQDWLDKQIRLSKSKKNAKDLLIENFPELAVLGYAVGDEIKDKLDNHYSVNRAKKNVDNLLDDYDIDLEDIEEDPFDYFTLTPLAFLFSFFVSWINILFLSRDRTVKI